MSDIDEPSPRAFATTRWAAVQLAKLACVTLLSAAVYSAARDGSIDLLRPTLSFLVLAIYSFGLVFLCPAAHLALLRRWRDASSKRFRIRAVLSALLVGPATLLLFITYSGELLLIPWLASVLVYGVWVSRPPLVVRTHKAAFRDGKYAPFG